MACALGVKQPTISEWLRGERRVPAERCPQIERETRRVAREKGDASLIVTCEQLRDDVAWEVLREQSADAKAA